MGSRVRGVVVVAVVLVVGAFLGSALSQWWTAPLPGEASVIPFLPAFDGDRIRVEVLNGGGRTGMAAAATDSLRDRGFDVVFFDTYRNEDGLVFDRDSTVVLSRSGDVAWAEAVAAALGTRAVGTEVDDDLYLDVTVILGADWEPALVPSPPEPEAPSKWDFRRWFRERPGAPDDARLADPGETG
jgi:hypothetical protein